MDENAEYCAIVAFTKDNDPTCEKNRQQLYALWTAYCMTSCLKMSCLPSLLKNAPKPPKLP